MGFFPKKKNNQKTQSWLKNPIPVYRNHNMSFTIVLTKPSNFSLKLLWKKADLTEIFKCLKINPPCIIKILFLKYFTFSSSYKRFIYSCNIKIFIKIHFFIILK